MNALIQGFILGLAFAMPLGVQNLFVIHRALTDRLPRAYWTSILVSMMDVSLGVGCFLGVGAIVEKAPFIKPLLLIGGAVFMFWIAWGLFKTKAHAPADFAREMSLSMIAKTSFVLTWFNPHALADGSVILGSYSAKLTAQETPFFLLGLIVASPTWFFGLTTVVGTFAHIISNKQMIWINRVSAVGLLILGTILLSNLVDLT